MRCSVLIPVRNGGRWLAESVASALSECGPEDEVVVIDDGSTDGGVEGLPDRPDLTIIRQEPLGIVPALERGRAACGGTYVARLDADDRALAGRLDAQIAALESDADLVAIGGRARLFVDEGVVPEGMAHYVAWVNALRDPHPQILVESPLFHPAVTFRADAVREVGGYRSGDVPEDYDLWLRLVRAGGRLRNIDREVVAIRDHPGRLTRTDPRYRRAAFDACRRAHLAATVLSAPRRVLLWAGKQGGRPWISWLKDAGHHVVGIIDLAAGTPRQGVPVVGAEALTGRAFDMVIVAVGSRGARDQIRQRIAADRPDLTEGVHWLAVL